MGNNNSNNNAQAMALANPSNPANAKNQPVPDTLQIKVQSQVLELEQARKPDARMEGDGPVLLALMLANLNNKINPAQSGPQPVPDTLQVKVQSQVLELEQAGKPDARAEGDGPLLLGLTLTNVNNANEAALSGPKPVLDSLQVKAQDLVLEVVQSREPGAANASVPETLQANSRCPASELRPQRALQEACHFNGVKQKPVGSLSREQLQFW